MAFHCSTRLAAQPGDIGGVLRRAVLENGRARNEHVGAGCDRAPGSFRRDSTVHLERDSTPAFCNAFSGLFDFPELACDERLSAEARIDPDNQNTVDKTVTISERV